MAAKQLALQQLLETNKGMYGLATDGSVWVYQGAKHGWSKLNMSMMSAKELEAKYSKPKRSVGDDWNDPPFG